MNSNEMREKRVAILKEKVPECLQKGAHVDFAILTKAERVLLDSGLYSKNMYRLCPTSVTNLILAAQGKKKEKILNLSGRKREKWK